MIGKKIFELRRKNNLSQEVLAEKLNVSRQTIYNWESESVIPPADKLFELSKIFEVPIESFFIDEIAIADADSKQDLKTVAENSETQEEVHNDISQVKTPRHQKLKSRF